MISMLWLEAPSSNEHIAVGSVRLVRVVLLRKHLLDVMIALIAGAFNPDPFRLIYRWYGHGFSPHMTLAYVTFELLSNPYKHFARK